MIITFVFKLLTFLQEVMLSLTGRLSESYSMQEKLAAENADLEGLRYVQKFFFFSIRIVANRANFF